MKNPKFYVCLCLCLTLALGSCVRDKFEEGIIENEEAVTAITDLEIPEGFNFSTHKTVNVAITDPADFVKYAVLNNGNNVFSGLVVNQQLQGQISLPTNTTQVTLVRRNSTSLESITVDLNGDQILFNHN